MSLSKLAVKNAKYIAGHLNAAVCAVQEFDKDDFMEAIAPHTYEHGFTDGQETQIPAGIGNGRSVALIGAAI